MAKDSKKAGGGGMYFNKTFTEMDMLCFSCSPSFLAWAGNLLTITAQFGSGVYL